MRSETLTKIRNTDYVRARTWGPPFNFIMLTRVPSYSGWCLVGSLRVFVFQKNCNIKKLLNPRLSTSLTNVQFKDLSLFNRLTIHPSWTNSLCVFLLRAYTCVIHLDRILCLFANSGEHSPASISNIIHVHIKRGFCHEQHRGPLKEIV